MIKKRRTGESSSPGVNAEFEPVQYKELPRDGPRHKVPVPWEAHFALQPAQSTSAQPLPSRPLGSSKREISLSEGLGLESPAGEQSSSSNDPQQTAQW